MIKRLREISDSNASAIDRLLTLRGDLVPFIGAGFSCPVCPGWASFLDSYYESMKAEFLTESDLTHYASIAAGDCPDRFEQIAHFLVDSSGRRRFTEQLESEFKRICPPQHVRKFHRLHRAFPGLKVTTNYDFLIEDNHPDGKHVEVARGNRPKDLERLFTRRDENCLLKIHGDIRDLQSIVLASVQYREMYGHPREFDIEAPLPAFLKRLFTNSPVVFIGCSLEYDRVLAVLRSLDDARPHFALMKRPRPRDEIVRLNRRLSDCRITPVWIEDFDDIPKILERLAPRPSGKPLKPLEPVTAFVGREAELDQIRGALDRGEGGIQMITGRLFNVEGSGGVGKSTLALEAARRFGHLAQDGVLPLFRADEMNVQSYAVELARALEIAHPESPADERSAQDMITAMLKDRRCLIILDNAVDWRTLRYMLPRETASIIIVTTRDRDLGTRIRSQFRENLKVHEIRLSHFSPEESLNLFRELLAGEYRIEDEPGYGRIAKELGYLPIALRQVIALMKYSPHYTAGELIERLQSDGRLALVRNGQARDDSDERTIDAVFDLASPALTDQLGEALETLAVCAPGPVPVSFLEHLTGSGRIGELFEELYTYSWCERRDRGAERHYEVHQLVRELIFERFGRRFSARLIAVVDSLFLDETVDFTVKDSLIAQFNEALDVAEQIRDDRVIRWLYQLYNYCKFRGQHTSYVRLTEIVEHVFGDRQYDLAQALGRRALILKAWGKLEEAMALHRKEEEIRESLGDRSGLAACYGNQALILIDLGKLDEAMALHRKVEEIYEVLGDRAGLAACFGNQALILKAWGKLDEAMALLRKVEEICESLGDRAGLAASYGNQALILADWGKLDEAMALHRKVEEIYEVLGDRAGVAAIYGNQALILRAWGKLDEAMALFRKQEEICEALGDRAGLARTWWNQGIISGTQGHRDKQVELWKRSIETNQSMGIPTEVYERALNVLLGTDPDRSP